ncbi:nitrogen fixation protein NifQ [Azorhizobium oxalatiphilum]|uniref:nitrogen fixation protein NifQ n=1 Tax=Azorhizobium oxalatiphilum TaxID=980631 RepID=UPI001FCEF234|nr:nitrogen fixation protein NifQ [Azorhizobium oxalatiphilum]
MPAARATRGETDAAAIYRRLTGCDPITALIGDDTQFDRHVLASILALAASEGGSVARHAGLSVPALAALLHRHFPLAGNLGPRWHTAAGPEDDEAAMVRDLLLSRRAPTGETGVWLAGMVARRAMEPNHLWEDLGLRQRAELTRLMGRHFTPLAKTNINNMRWKRFLYRALCEDDGFVMCSTPVCTQCADFDLCFGDESGESRMAERRRALERATPSLSPS